MRAFDRREFLETAGLAAAGCMCRGGMATFGFPTVRFARVPGEARLVFVLLRGGVDGLAAVVPIGDPDYGRVRGPLALEREGLVPLDGTFALAPGLGPLRSFWERGEMTALHAMAIPYRTRSHFDGQAVLETGLARPVGSTDGWLNRLLGVMGGERTGLAVAAGLPRSLSGPQPVSTWSPVRLGAVEDGYLERLALLYRADPLLHDPFEAALQQREATEGMEPVGGRRAAPTALFRAAARLLASGGGANVAAVEFSGWDTHANQGGVDGPLDRLLGRLAAGLEAFRREMGPAWEHTVVVVMTEFGRTAAPNGTRGTDHGTAGAGLLLGPRLAGSRVVADWPGLGRRDLYEGRDLRPTLDTRAALKGVVAGTFDLTAAQADRVFPGSEGVGGLYDLMR